MEEGETAHVFFLIKAAPKPGGTQRDMAIYYGFPVSSCCFLSFPLLSELG